MGYFNSLGPVLELRKCVVEQMALKATHYTQYLTSDELGLVDGRPICRGMFHGKDHPIAHAVFGGHSHVAPIEPHLQGVDDGKDQRFRKCLDPATSIGLATPVVRKDNSNMVVQKDLSDVVKVKFALAHSTYESWDELELAHADAVEDGFNKKKKCRFFVSSMYIKMSPWGQRIVQGWLSKTFVLRHLCGGD